MITVMRIINSIIILLLIAACSQDEKKSNSGSVIVDDLGSAYEGAESPKRIVTLAPNLTEMIYRLNLEKYLVGNTTYCDFPEASREIEKVGDMLSIDYEKMILLKPEVVFITIEGNTKETFAKLKEIGAAVFVTNPRSYEGIKKTLHDIASIFNITIISDSIISDWDFRVSAVEEKSKRYPEHKAMFLVSVKPIMLAGPNTFINDFLVLCNLRNIADDADINYPFFSREEVIKRNPDLILHTSHNYSDMRVLTAEYGEWRNVKAVKEGRIFYLEPDLYFRPGPRFVDALENLFFTIHPEAARGLNQEQ